MPGKHGDTSRLGTLRTHESTRKLARRLENGTARILSATVSRTAQRWFVSFAVEAERDSLTLAGRVFKCEPCGLVIDRDVNAARNLLNLAASGAESRNACGGTVRPGRAGQVPVNQEPGIPNGSQTGTASGQLEAVA